MPYTKFLQVKDTNLRSERACKLDWIELELRILDLLRKIDYKSWTARHINTADHSWVAAVNFHFIFWSTRFPEFLV